jgi:hypothetical protein
MDNSYYIISYYVLSITYMISEQTFENNSGKFDSVRILTARIYEEVGSQTYIIIISVFGVFTIIMAHIKRSMHHNFLPENCIVPVFLKLHTPTLFTTN